MVKKKSETLDNFLHACFLFILSVKGIVKFINLNLEIIGININSLTTKWACTLLLNFGVRDVTIYKFYLIHHTLLISLLKYYYQIQIIFLINCININPSKTQNK